MALKYLKRKRIFLLCTGLFIFSKRSSFRNTRQIKLADMEVTYQKYPALLLNLMRRHSLRYLAMVKLRKYVKVLQ